MFVDKEKNHMAAASDADKNMQRKEQKRTLLWGFVDLTAHALKCFMEGATCGLDSFIKPQTRGRCIW